MASREQLEAHFGKGSLEKEDLLTEAQSICRMYGLSAEDLFWKWEAFVMSSTSAHAGASMAVNKARQKPDFDLTNARELKKEIQMSLKPAAAVKLEPGLTGNTPNRTFNKKPLGKGGFDNLQVLDGLSTPTANKKKPITTNNNVTPFTAKKPAPRPSALNNLQFSDEMSTPAKAGPSRSTDPATTPTLIKTEHNLIKTEHRPPAPSTFETRTNSLEVVECLNAHLETQIPPASMSSRVKLQTTADPRSYNYRYMFEKLMDRSEALDNRIDECAELIKSSYELDEELGDPTLESQEDMYCVGRVCTDLYMTKFQDPTERNKVSIWLESSRMMGGGNRVELRFASDVSVKGSEAADGGASLFPGCIIGVKGRNVGGQYFQVQEILMMPPFYSPVSAPSELFKYQYESTKDAKLQGLPFSVMAACGPYTTEDNLSFAPFDAFIEEARMSRPDVLILLGPFIDTNHPAIRFGEIDQNLITLYREQFLSRLNSLCSSSPATTCIIIPAIRDILNHHVVYPQGPFDKDLGLKRVKMLPNPAIFSINEIVFAVTSTDVLMPIKIGEYVKEAPRAPDAGQDMAIDDDVPKDAVSRVCRHILRQRIFYPVFPAPLAGAGLDNVNLDVTHLDLLKLGEGGVDVLITPSSLGKHFVKMIDTTAVVNPSLLTRGSAAGTFARMTVFPMDKRELTSDVRKAQSDQNLVIEHKLWERGKIEIVRI